MGLAVVAHENDDGVVGESVVLELAEHATDLAVEFAGIVQIGCPVLAGHGWSG